MFTPLTDSFSTILKQLDAVNMVQYPNTLPYVDDAPKSPWYKYHELDPYEIFRITMNNTDLEIKKCKIRAGICHVCRA